MSESKKISIECKLCEHNFQNEYCQINDGADEFLDSFECGGFSFCHYHLVEYLKELKK